MNDAERILAAPPGRIAALLGPALPAPVVERLLGAPRFAPRLRALAAERLGDLPALDPRQAAALALDGTGFEDLAARAGAIWHAAALARVVDGAERRGVIAALGPAAYRSALEGRALAPADEPPEPATADELAGAAASDGAACCEAWRRSQPEPVASRLSLVFDGPPPRRDHAIHGPAILAFLLERA